MGEGFLVVDSLPNVYDRHGRKDITSAKKLILYMNIPFGLRTASLDVKNK